DEKGLITRTRGGATATDYPSQELLRRSVPAYEKRLNEYIEEKQSIGQCAAEHIHDGETIILDASSTNHYVLPYLTKKRDLTVINNSLYISKELMTIIDTNPRLTVISSVGILFISSYWFISMIV